MPAKRSSGCGRGSAPRSSARPPRRSRCRARRGPGRGRRTRRRRRSRSRPRRSLRCGATPPRRDRHLRIGPGRLVAGADRRDLRRERVGAVGEQDDRLDRVDQRRAAKAGDLYSSASRCSGRQPPRVRPERASESPSSPTERRPEPGLGGAPACARSSAGRRSRPARARALRPGRQQGRRRVSQRGHDADTRSSWLGVEHCAVPKSLGVGEYALGDLGAGPDPDLLPPPSPRHPSSRPRGSSAPSQPSMAGCRTIARYPPSCASRSSATSSAGDEVGWLDRLGEPASLRGPPPTAARRSRRRGGATGTAAAPTRARRRHQYQRASIAQPCRTQDPERRRRRVAPRAAAAAPSLVRAAQSRRSPGRGSRPARRPDSSAHSSWHQAW